MMTTPFAYIRLQELSDSSFRIQFYPHMNLDLVEELHRALQDGADHFNADAEVMWNEHIAAAEESIAELNELMKQERDSIEEVNSSVEKLNKRMVQVTDYINDINTEIKTLAVSHSVKQGAISRNMKETKLEQKYVKYKEELEEVAQQKKSEIKRIEEAKEKLDDYHRKQSDFRQLQERLTEARQKTDLMVQQGRGYFLVYFSSDVRNDEDLAANFHVRTTLNSLTMINLLSAAGWELVTIEPEIAAAEATDPNVVVQYLFGQMVPFADDELELLLEEVESETGESVEAESFTEGEPEESPDEDTTYEEQENK